MTRRLLIIEPDASARALLDRVLTASGYATEDVEAAQHARLLLDDGAYDLALVDELAGGSFLADVASLRRDYPQLPLVVTGTMLSVGALLDLMRLGIPDALPKPFTPPELRDAVARVLARATWSHVESVEFAAAITAARAHIVSGDLARAGPALARAYAQAPFDPEIAALQALRAEIEGRDAEAARGYRAAIALRHDEDDAAPDAREGLSRLAAYGEARPVTTLDPRFRDAPLVLVSGALETGVRVDETAITVFTLGLGAPGAARVFLRQSATRAYALLTTSLEPERVADALAALGPGRILTMPADDARHDIARITGLRDQARTRQTPGPRP